MKCECNIRLGKTRIRGFHNSKKCDREAGYVWTKPDGGKQHMCGVHATAHIRKFGNRNMELIAD